jgi:hypothetical protein
MAVAERFGAKTETISELKIEPTATYLLAAPSAPDEARQAAVQPAESGEGITTGVTKEILAKLRQKARRAGGAFAAPENAVRTSWPCVRGAPLRPVSGRSQGEASGAPGSDRGKNTLSDVRRDIHSFKILELPASSSKTLGFPGKPGAFPVPAHPHPCTKKRNGG